MLGLYRLFLPYAHLRPLLRSCQPKNPSIPKAPCSANHINSSTCASVMGMKSTFTGFLGQKNTFECCCHEGFLDLDLPITEFCWVGWHQTALNHHVWVMMWKNNIDVLIYKYDKEILIQNMSKEFPSDSWQQLVTCDFAAFFHRAP